MNGQPIGVFDSGVGGISVLNELVRCLPHEDFIFYGDNKNAPYGVKSPEEVRMLSTRCVEYLIDKGVKAVVVACNTASSASVEHLREHFSIPIVAMEPAIRPASKLRNGGKIMVLATEATLQLERYQNRLAELDIVEDTLSVPCPRFVELVERGVTGGPELERAIREALCHGSGEDVDVVVLGCTHFVHIKEAIAGIAKEMFPHAVIIDGNEGTAHQLKRVLAEKGLTATEDRKGKIELHSSGAPEVYIPIMERMLHQTR